MNVTRCGAAASADEGGTIFVPFLGLQSELIAGGFAVPGVSDCAVILTGVGGDDDGLARILLDLTHQ